MLNPGRKLYDVGQRLRLDHIPGELLGRGKLEHDVHDRSVTGLPSDPTIAGRAIRNSASSDEEIRQKRKEASSVEARSAAIQQERAT